MVKIRLHCGRYGQYEGTKTCSFSDSTSRLFCKHEPPFHRLHSFASLDSGRSHRSTCSPGIPALDKSTVECLPSSPIGGRISTMAKHTRQRANVLQGTLDMLILRTLLYGP